MFGYLEPEIVSAKGLFRFGPAVLSSQAYLFPRRKLICFSLLIASDVLIRSHQLAELIGVFNLKPGHRGFLMRHRPYAICCSSPTIDYVLRLATIFT